MAKRQWYTAGAVVGEVGVTVANSDDNGDDAVAQTFYGTGGSGIYRADSSFPGGWCMELTQATAANQPVGNQFSEGAGSSQFSVYAFVKIPSYPSGECTLMQLRSTTDALLLSWNLNANGTIALRGAAGVLYASGAGAANTFPTGTLVRLAMYGTGLGGAAGQLNGALFSGFGNTPIDTMSSASNISTTGLVDRWRWGRMSSVNLAAWRVGGVYSDFTVGTLLPAPLLPPAGLTATPFSSTRIDLSWTAAGGATGYDIERDGSIVAANVAGTAYSDTSLSPSTLYSYRVRSVN